MEFNELIREANALLDPVITILVCVWAFLVITKWMLIGATWLMLRMAEYLQHWRMK